MLVAVDALGSTGDPRMETQHEQVLAMFLRPGDRKVIELRDGSRARDRRANFGSRERKERCRYPAAPHGRQRVADKSSRWRLERVGAAEGIEFAASTSTLKDGQSPPDSIMWPRPRSLNQSTNRS
jgi:hypothetical protein